MGSPLSQEQHTPALTANTYSWVPVAAENHDSDSGAQRNPSQTIPYLGWIIINT